MPTSICPSSRIMRPLTLRLRSQHSKAWGIASVAARKRPVEPEGKSSRRLEPDEDEAFTLLDDILSGMDLHAQPAAAPEPTSSHRATTASDTRDDASSQEPVRPVLLTRTATRPWEKPPAPLNPPPASARSVDDSVPGQPDQQQQQQQQPGRAGRRPPPRRGGPPPSRRAEGEAPVKRRSSGAYAIYLGGGGGGNGSGSLDQIDVTPGDRAGQQEAALGLRKPPPPASSSAPLEGGPALLQPRPQLPAGLQYPPASEAPSGRSSPPVSSSESLGARYSPDPLILAARAAAKAAAEAAADPASSSNDNNGSLLDSQRVTGRRTGSGRAFGLLGPNPLVQQQQWLGSQRTPGIPGNSITIADQGRAPAPFTSRGVAGPSLPPSRSSRTKGGSVSAAGPSAPRSSEGILVSSSRSLRGARAAVGGAGGLASQLAEDLARAETQRQQRDGRRAPASQWGGVQQQRQPGGSGRSEQASGWLAEAARPVVALQGSSELPREVTADNWRLLVGAQFPKVCKGGMKAASARTVNPSGNIIFCSSRPTINTLRPPHLPWGLLLLVPLSPLRPPSLSPPRSSLRLPASLAPPQTAP